MLKLFSSAALLLMIMGCQEDNESIETSIPPNNFGSEIKKIQINDSIDATISKKVKGYKKKKE